MARLIGTAGHVDHGKTALIRALTGIDADRLPEEKSRGMTIDIGFAYLDLEGHGRVSIVDVPGHEKFLTNMLVGALGIDVALLCVAADESVMPQTREHLQILDLLPVDRMVVALTRSDLADSEVRAFCRLEVEELLAPTRFAGAPTVETSATTGEGIDELRRQLSIALAGPETRDDGAWYLPVDRAFVVKGYGTVVTGTLARGRVAKGDEAILVPGNEEVRVRGIQAHGVDAPSAESGMRVALNLGGVRLEDVRRGCAVGARGALFETSCLDATVRWVAEAKHGLRIRVSIGAEEAVGRLFLSESDSGIAQLRLETAVACAMRQPLVIRRYSPQDLLGGGRVLVPQARPRRVKDAHVHAEGESAEEAVLSVVARAPEGIPTEEVCRVLGRTAQDLGSTFEALKKDGRLLGFAGLWLAPESFSACVERLHRALLELHEKEPARSSHPREKALKAAGLRWSGKPLDRIIASLSNTGRIMSRGTEIAHPEFRIRLNARQAELLDRAVAAMDELGVNAPNARDLAGLLSVPVQAAEEILKVGVQSGRLVRLADDLYYSVEQIERLKSFVRDLGARGKFTAAEFRDALGTTRKYAIPILEYFDSIRLTTRMGEHRLVQQAEP